MQAVWLVRSHQLNVRMRFWTAIVGYDPRDRSLSHRIYLVYTFIFFSVWGFAMLALIAEPAVWLLSLFKGTSAVVSAVIVITVVLILDILLRGFIYARRSPFSFSEEDQMLICLTPVDRRQVALAWLFGDWIPAGIPYWVGVVTLSFACLQITTPQEIVWVHLPTYLLMGFRALSIIFPLHFALMTSAYAFGAYRLRGAGEVTYLRLIPLGIGVALVSMLFFSPASLRIILWPVQYPLAAGFGEAVWIIGFTLAVFMGILSLLLLYTISPKLNLSRASQETSSSLKFRQAGILEGGPISD